MRIAAFNVENLFDRAKAFNEPDRTARKVLRDAAALNSLFEYGNYTALRKQRMLDLFVELGLTKSDRGPFVVLRQIRERIVKRGAAGLEIVADGRDDWVGWVEVKTEPVNERSVDNTGRVIRDVDADILAVIEAEDRVALDMFSERVLDRVGGRPYEHVMVIDGNDERGIDVGLMTRDGFDIGDMRSHIDDLDAAGRTIFSRDCPEYAVTTPEGDRVWVLPNHFKSKYGGNSRASRAQRTAQAARTAEIYRGLRAAGERDIVVLGDLNDTPGSAPLAPLLDATDLVEVSALPLFDPGEFPGIGTFRLGNDNQKIDYLLLSPSLARRVTAAGLFRKGAWPGVRPRRWETYPELTHRVHVASDHHVIWADIE
jgi:endonuclease/exonuclease/phosphatase family metal-dependent hydrolase